MSKFTRVVNLKMVSLLVLLVQRSIMGNVYLVPGVALVVIRMDIK